MLDAPSQHLNTLKGTHTVFYSSSFFVINQKPVTPRTDFQCITKGCMFF